MTHTQELQKELDVIMNKFRNNQKENTASNDFPKLTKKYQYRKSSVIKANDIIL